MKIVLSIILPLVLVVVAYGYVVNAKPNLIIEAQLLFKNLENPEEDAIADINSKKIKCIELNGFAPYMPGVESNEAKKVCDSHETENIAGTSDYILSNQHLEVTEKATIYAFKYNTYIVSHAK